MRQSLFRQVELKNLLKYTSKCERRRIMPLIHLVITLVVVGVILWLINTYIPMQATIKKILNAVVVIAVIIWLLNVFGFIGPISGFRIGR
jgi:hypothetical protein